MRIVCPSCAAAYDVPDDRLAPGRVVKCAQCGTGWAPVVAVLRTEPVAAPVPVVPPMPVAPPAPAPMQIFERLAATASALPPIPPKPPAPKPAAPPLPGPPAMLVLGWVASIVVLLALAGGAYVWRAEVMQAWPASERGYALLGLVGR